MSVTAIPGAASAVPEPTPHDASHATPWWASRRSLAVTSIIMGALSFVWITVTLITTSRGFDVTDEGGYLLSYRWWDENLRTFSGAQYFYGPVFELLGYNIAWLRVFRLFTVLVVAATFGWTFMRWLRVQRPQAPASRLWEVAGTLTVVACAGMVYSWLPLSPGYNDVSLLGAMLLTSVLFVIAVDVSHGRDPRLWPLVGSGVAIAVMLLSKWASTAVVMPWLALVAAVLLWPRGWRAILRFVLAVLGGIVGALVLIQILVVPLNQAVPLLLSTNKLTASESNSPFILLEMYLRSTGDVLYFLATSNYLLPIAAVLAVALVGRRVRLLGIAVVVVALAAATGLIFAFGQLRGGTIHLVKFPTAVTLLVLTAVVLAVALVLFGLICRRRSAGSCDMPLLASDSGRTWLLMITLLLVPVLSSAGTGNPVLYMAVNGTAVWAAFTVFVATGTFGSPPAAQLLGAAIVLGLCVLSVVISATASWFFPYRTAPSATATQVAQGVPALKSLSLAPPTADSFAALHARLTDYLTPGRYIMAFDEMPGVVLALDGQSVGEAWYSRADPRRTAINITTECADGPPWGAQLPLVLFNRLPADSDIAAFASCGIDFNADYVLLAEPRDTAGVAVFVPSVEFQRVTESASQGASVESTP